MCKVGVVLTREHCEKYIDLNMYTKISNFKMLSLHLPTMSNSLGIPKSLSISHPKFRVHYPTIIRSAAKLPDGLLPEHMPKHVGFILDGNRRWARERGLMVQIGHRPGGQKVMEITRMCADWGVKVLSVFAFSTENWVRPKEEVDFLMRFFEEVIQNDLEEYHRNGVRFSVIGDRSKFPISLQEAIGGMEETTKGNTRIHLLAAINYSGRYDILQACKKVANKVRDGVMQLEDIDDMGMFDKHLETSCVEFPNPDLLIRTSGEHRVSNFMLWQLAYTELLFVKKKFPDFGEADLVEALCSFQQRQRRFGGHKY